MAESALNSILISPLVEYFAARAVITMMTPQEFARLVDTQGPALVLYARQWCGAPEDVVQEAFIKLAGQRKPPRDALAWLYRVARNGAIDCGRSEQRRQRRESAVARPQQWFVEREVDGLDE